MSATTDLPETKTIFELTIPSFWSELDVRPATRDRAIRTVLEERLAEVPQLHPRRSEIVRYYRDLVRDAWDNGARYCASFVAPAGDGFLMGALTVNILPSAPPLAGGSTLDAVVEQVQEDQGAQGAGVWRSVTTETLPGAGPAVRVFGAQSVQIDKHGTQAVVVFMQTYVPLDNAVLLVACASPAVDVADSILELFASVSNSLVLTKDEDA